MSWTAAALLLAAATATLLLAIRARRRRRETRQAMRARFESTGGRIEGLRLERQRGGWRVAVAGGRPFELAERRLLDAARRAERAGEPGPDERWAVQLAWSAAPPPLLDGPFHLKAHGPRVLPRLCHPEVAHCLPAAPRPAWRPSALAPLGTLYLLLAPGEPGRLVTEEALREAGVDGRDLAGIALAVLRQRFEEEIVARALAGEIVELRPEDGSGAARALVAGDFLREGQALLAVLPTPETLLLAPPTCRDLLLETARRHAGPAALREPLPPRPVRIDRRGVRWADLD